MFCYRVLSVISDFVIISLGKRERWLLYFCCVLNAKNWSVVCDSCNFFLSHFDSTSISFCENTTFNNNDLDLNRSSSG